MGRRDRPATRRLHPHSRRSRRTSIPQWEANGHIERVIRLAEAWVRAAAGARPRGRDRAPARAARRCSSSTLPGTGRAHGAAVRPPRQAAGDDRLARRISARGMPVLEDGKLYGRGGADDGYAVFASLAAIGALQAQGIAARALRRHDRDLRGERQLRPAGLPRAARAAHGRASISSSASIPAAATTSGCGRRRRCAASPAAR